MKLDTPKAILIGLFMVAAAIVSLPLLLNDFGISYELSSIASAIQDIEGCK